MKESTGELNATIFVILAVGVLMAFFYYTLWPLIRTNFDENSKCNKAICEACEEDNSTYENGTCGYVECHAKGDTTNTFQCVYKG